MNPTAKPVSERIRKIVASHPAERESLIPILQDIQDELGYINELAVDEIAEALTLLEKQTLFHNQREGNRTGPGNCLWHRLPTSG